MANQPALTGIHFKNWRSLRDVTIDNLTPITVFVGANSSGKTNIFDAFRFLRDAETDGTIEANYAWRVREKIRTMGVANEEPVGLTLFLNPNYFDGVVQHLERLVFEGNTVFFFGGNSKSELFQQELNENKKTSEYITRCWQLLSENFMPPRSIPSESDPGNSYLIEPSARNVPFMLYVMQQTKSQIYSELQKDLRWLLSHIDKTEVEQDDLEIRLMVRESDHSGEKASTISAGTSRLIAMLTAYYALDMRTSDLPGLIVIEEPDTAIHPLLLQKFVELLRGYTEKENPRQFILTTHNPMFLNFFKPEEVRIVERDEHGETTVSNVDMDVAKVWLEQDGAYNLGNLWTTRLLGGVP